MTAIFLTIGVVIIGVILVMGGMSGDFSTILKTTAPVLIGVVVIIAGIIGIYNSLIGLKNQVKNAYAQIKVQLKRRHDLIPNLVEVVKKYASHEEGVLTKVVQARSLAGNISSDAKVQAQNENALSATLKSLFAVAENYPDLKANQNFMQLSEELVSTENKVSFARQFYNDSVMQYNIKKETFPSNIIAGMFNFENFELFELDSPEEAKAVKVNFD